MQVLQNRAARTITKKSWFTPTSALLACNWLSIKQLIFYQTVAAAHKIIQTGVPSYLSEKLSTEYPRYTRQSTWGYIRFGESFTGTGSLCHSSFTYRAREDYNRIPWEIKQANNMNTFKYKLKKWTLINIPIT